MANSAATQELSLNGPFLCDRTAALAVDLPLRMSRFVMKLLNTSWVTDRICLAHSFVLNVFTALKVTQFLCLFGIFLRARDRLVTRRYAQ